MYTFYFLTFFNIFDIRIYNIHKVEIYYHTIVTILYKKTPKNTHFFHKKLCNKCILLYLYTF